MADSPAQHALAYTLVTAVVHAMALELTRNARIQLVMRTAGQSPVALCTTNASHVVTGPSEAEMESGAWHDARMGIAAACSGPEKH